MVKKVKKFDGSIENFDKEKIIKSIMKAGGSRELGEEIVRVVEEKFKDQEIVTTTQIRRIILIELGKKDPEVKDSYLFYDRLVKGRITFEAGKFLVIREGALYMGKNVRDIGAGGLTHLEEVRGLIEEFEEDMLVGGYREDLAERRSRILIQAIKDSKMSDNDKKKAIELVNNFRRKYGFSIVD
ncbi:MAG: ATP cone domain-containing protein [Candidatus Njordarchaeota archaeon]